MKGAVVLFIHYSVLYVIHCIIYMIYTGPKNELKKKAVVFPNRCP